MANKLNFRRSFDTEDPEFEVKSESFVIRLEVGVALFFYLKSTLSEFHFCEVCLKEGSVCVNGTLSDTLLYAPENSEYFVVNTVESCTLEIKTNWEIFDF